MIDKHRNCREAPLYRRHKAELQPDPRKFEEVEAIYSQLIASSPENNEVVDGTPGWRRQRTRPGIGGWAPALYIYYTIVDDDHCELQAVERADTIPSIQSIFDRL